MRQSNQIDNFSATLTGYQQYWGEGDYRAALKLIDEVLVKHPDHFEFLWYRCCCLEKLGRHQQVLDEVNAKQEELNERWEKLDDQVDDLDELDSEPLKLNDLALFKLTVQGMPADICQIFRSHLASDKQLPVCDHLIALKPDSDELYFERGDHYLAAASWFDFYDNEDLSKEQIDEIIKADPDIIRDFMGMAYSKFKLKKALFNFQKAISLSSKQVHYYVKVARVLHLLQRFDEALKVYDQALELVDKNDPRYRGLLQQRRASEGHGKGERDQMADSLSAVYSTKKNRSIEDDVSYAIIKSMEDAVRSGKGMDNIFDELISDDPLDLTALNIARQIYDVAHEPAMKFVEADLKTIPAYQSKHILQIKKQAPALGYNYLCTVEAPNVSAVVGQQIFMGVFGTKDHKSVMSAFTMKPKWPGKVVFLLMLLTGKWRKQPIVIISSVLDNNHYIDTRRTAIQENLKGGPFFHSCIMSLRTPLQTLVQTHAQRVKKLLAKYPTASQLSLRTLKDFEKASENEVKLKREYRRSIGYVTDEELKAMLGKHYNQLALKIRQKLKILARSDVDQE